MVVTSMGRPTSARLPRRTIWKGSTSGDHGKGCISPVLSTIGFSAWHSVLSGVQVIALTTAATSSQVWPWAPNPGPSSAPARADIPNAAEQVDRGWPPGVCAGRSTASIFTKLCRKSTGPTTGSLAES